MSNDKTLLRAELQYWRERAESLERHVDKLRALVRPDAPKQQRLTELRHVHTECEPNSRQTLAPLKLPAGTILEFYKIVYARAWWIVRFFPDSEKAEEKSDERMFTLTDQARERCTTTVYSRLSEVDEPRE